MLGRAIYGESDQDVADKFKVAQDGGLIPILCVGETLEERESGNTESVVARQIQAVINLVGIEKFDQAVIAYEPVWAIGTGKTATPEMAVIAYEPVWAIGTGKTATPEMAQDVHKFIRDMLSALNSDISNNLRLLYGGSMNAENAEALIGMADIDGGLIGGASLQAESFLAICKAAN
jgi:triosephosphate isomerase